MNKDILYQFMKGQTHGFVKVVLICICLGAIVVWNYFSCKEKQISMRMQPPPQMNMEIATNCEVVKLS